MGSEHLHVVPVTVSDGWALDWCASIAKMPGTSLTSVGGDYIRVSTDDGLTWRRGDNLAG